MQDNFFNLQFSVQPEKSFLLSALRAETSFLQTMTRLLQADPEAFPNHTGYLDPPARSPPSSLVSRRSPPRGVLSRSMNQLFPVNKTK